MAGISTFIRSDKAEIKKVVGGILGVRSLCPSILEKSGAIHTLLREHLEGNRYHPIVRKEMWGTRVMTEPNGNNSIIIRQSAGLLPKLVILEIRLMAEHVGCIFIHPRKGLND